MPLSSDTRKALGMCLAVHFGFTEEVKEDENGREEGEEGPLVEDEEKEVDESIHPSPPTPYPSEISTPDHWYYDPYDQWFPRAYDPYDGWEVDAYFEQGPGLVYVGFDGMDESRYARPKFFDFFNDRIERAVAVADAERSVCRLRFLLLQKG